MIELGQRVELMGTQVENEEFMAKDQFELEVFKINSMTRYLFYFKIEHDFKMNIK